MTVTRRGLLAAGATAATGLVAGCTDFVADSLSSDAATVSGDALAATGYAEHTVEEVVVERTVGRFGIERTIEARNWYAEYDRAVEFDSFGPGIGPDRLQAAVVSALTTPQVSVLGKTFNPVGDYSTDELVALIQSRYDELEGVERVDEAPLSILGAEATVVRYRAEARLIEAGTTLDVFLQVSEPVAHGDDFVIGVAVYPQVVGYDTESDDVRTLLEGLEHS